MQVPRTFLQNKEKIMPIVFTKKAPILPDFDCTVDSSFAVSYSNAPRGIAYDGTNLITVESQTDMVYVHVGLTSATSTNFSTPGIVPTGITYDTTLGNLITCDLNTDLIYIHSGVTSTISSSFASPSTGPIALTIANGNLVSADIFNNNVYVHSGITSTITDTLSFPGNSITGLAWDGEFLIVATTPEIRFFLGLTDGSPAKTCSPPAGGTEGLVWLGISPTQRMAVIDTNIPDTVFIMN